MSREVQPDFERLSTFVDGYNLKDSSTVPEFKQLLKKLHRRYFAVLTLLGEIHHQDLRPVPRRPGSRKMNLSFRGHLSESASDLGLALFVWIHGGYKGSRQILRSSIENFLKSIGSVEHPAITELKNVYEVIDLAGDIQFFKQPTNKKMFADLKKVYTELCKDVHTAGPLNMANINSLGYFPNFDASDARAFEAIFLSVSNTYATILSLMFKETFHSMHFRNKDIVQGIIAKSVRKRLYTGEE